MYGSWRLACTTSFTFIAFFCTGLSLAMVPGWVHKDLGLSAVVTGFAVGVQYLATLLSRPLAGRLADQQGAKVAVTFGLCGIGASGLLALGSSLLTAPLWALAVLVMSRIALGIAQGVIGVAINTWGISEHGATQTTRVISWNGIAAYGAIALGAPLGIYLHHLFGNAALGLSLTLCAALGLSYLRLMHSPQVVTGYRPSFLTALKHVLPYGSILALASIGFGSLTAFITLYFAERHWPHAAFCLSAFGMAFIAARVIFIWTINRVGGLGVSLACLGIEVLGLALLALADSPSWAIVGSALAGFGLSLIYPALGVVALAKVPASSRGSTLGAYGVFFDLSLGLTGPLMGLIAASFGYQSIFWSACFLAVFALLLALWQQAKTQPS